MTTAAGGGGKAKDRGRKPDQSGQRALGRTCSFGRSRKQAIRQGPPGRSSDYSHARSRGLRVRRGGGAKAGGEVDRPLTVEALPGADGVSEGSARLTELCKGQRREEGEEVIVNVARGPKDGRESQVGMKDGVRCAPVDLARRQRESRGRRQRFVGRAAAVGEGEEREVVRARLERGGLVEREESASTGAATLCPSSSCRGRGG